MRAPVIVLTLLLAGCAGGMPRMPGSVPGTTRISGASSATFHFGPTALGQERDVDYHRAVLSGLIPAPGLQQYLNGIVQRLLAGSPVTGVPARVYVKATCIYGAESSGDANIYVNYRTLERVESEDEMAAILAHELAHVILGHPSADIVEDTQARLLRYTNMALAVHGAVAQQYGMKQGMAAHTAAVVGEAALLQLNQAVVGPYWVRSQEEEADLFGLDLLIRAGYDPRAMEASLDRLLAAEKENLDERGFNEQISTMFKEQWPDLIKQGRDEVAKRVVKMWIDSVVKKMKEDHPDTEKRKELVRKYREKNYASAPLKEPDTAGWREATRRKDKQSKRIFQSYSDAITASARLTQGEKAEALKLAKDAATADMRQHAFIADALYRARNANGERRDKTAQVFDPPARSTEPAWLAFQELGFAELTTGKRDAGIATLERGYDRLQRPPHAIPSLLFAYERVGAREKATALATDCATRFPRLDSVGGCKAQDPNEHATAQKDDPPTRATESNEAWRKFVPGGGWHP
jgi:Zn-dependent protease with chaperone function